jgi:hypothetical protein
MLLSWLGVRWFICFKKKVFLFSFTEHPLDSIAIGIVEARSFLFSYGDAGSGADSDKKKKSGAGEMLFYFRFREN